jgi:hypothetical protein
MFVARLLKIGLPVRQMSYIFDGIRDEGRALNRAVISPQRAKEISAFMHAAERATHTFSPASYIYSFRLSAQPCINCPKIRLTVECVFVFHSGGHINSLCAYRNFIISLKCSGAERKTDSNPRMLNCTFARHRVYRRNFRKA